MVQNIPSDEPASREPVGVIGLGLLGLGADRAPAVGRMSSDSTLNRTPGTVTQNSAAGLLPMPRPSRSNAVASCCHYPIPR